jgi:hypothetical protein
LQVASFRFRGTSIDLKFETYLNEEKELQVAGCRLQVSLT